MEVGFLAFNVLLHTKLNKKGQVINLVHQLALTICQKTVFDKEYTFTIFVGCVWVVIGYFLFKKEAFIGLIKVYKRIFSNLKSKTFA